MTDKDMKKWRDLAKQCGALFFGNDTVCMHEEDFLKFVQMVIKEAGHEAAHNRS